MNKTSKTVFATLALSLALVGCDSVVKNDKDGKAPVVEENTSEDSKAKENAPSDEKDEDKATDTKSEEETSVDSDEKSEEDSKKEEDDMANASDQDIREALDQAIFDNRSQARAIEILLEMTPEKVADIKPELEEMLEESNKLIDEAQATLDELDNK